MTEAPDETTPGWRIVLLTNIPGGQIYRQIAGEVRPLGRRITGVLTSPGPKRRRSDGYLDVVASAPPGTVLHADAARMVVQCGDGPLALIEWAET